MIKCVIHTKQYYISMYSHRSQIVIFNFGIKMVSINYLNLTIRVNVEYILSYFLHYFNYYEKFKYDSINYFLLHIVFARTIIRPKTINKPQGTINSRIGCG